MKNKLAMLSSFCAMLCMIFASDTVVKCSADAMRLCIEVIIPSLLPFVAITSLLRKTGFMYWLGGVLQVCAERLFGCSGEGTGALLIGLLGGYPLGAAEIASMLEERRISTAEAERLLAFCNNSGPAFIIGTVGVSVFSSVSKGIALYVIHILSAVICGIILKSDGKGIAAAECRYNPLPFSVAFTESVKNSLSVCLNVCGFIICFSVLSSIMQLCGVYGIISSVAFRLWGIDEALTCAFLTGLLEIGSGAGALMKLSYSSGAFCSAAFLLGFGGLSVHAQTAALFADSPVSLKKFFCGKLLCAFISAAEAYAAVLLMG